MTIGRDMRYQWTIKAQVSNGTCGHQPALHTTYQTSWKQPITHETYVETLEKKLVKFKHRFYENACKIFSTKYGPFVRLWCINMRELSGIIYLDSIERKSRAGVIYVSVLQLPTMAWLHWESSGNWGWELFSSPRWIITSHSWRPRWTHGLPAGVSKKGCVLPHPVVILQSRLLFWMLQAEVLKSLWPWILFREFLVFCEL